MKIRADKGGGVWSNDGFRTHREFKGGWYLPHYGEFRTWLEHKRIIQAAADEELVVEELARLTRDDVEYLEAMDEIFRGSKALRHDRVIKSRRIRALRILWERAYAAGDYPQFRRFYDPYQAMLQGILSLAV